MLSSAEAAIAVDRTKNSITVSRSFSAPCRRVFEAWTKPEQIAVWWDPSGAPLAECEVDLRIGGGFRFVNNGHGETPPFSGTYREICLPSRLVFEALGSVGTVELTEVDGGTHMKVMIVCASAETLDRFLKMGVDVGTSKTLDNLVDYLRSSSTP